MGKRGPTVSQRRLPASERRQQRAQEVWDDPGKRKHWPICVVCDLPFNLSTVKPEYRGQYKIRVSNATFHVCLGCANRNPRRIATMTYVLQRFAGRKCSRRKDEGHKKKTCTSLECTTRRLVRV